MSIIIKRLQINLSHMKKETQSTTTVEKTTSKDEKNPQHNPRRAATKVKQADKNIEIMKKRFKVLQVQNQYNRYKTLDQEKRIVFHEKVHESIEKERQKLKESLIVINDPRQLKEKNESLRKQIKKNIEQTKKTYLIARAEGYHQIKSQFNEHETIIHEQKKSFVLQNKQRKHQIEDFKSKQKVHVQQFKEQKIKETILNKSIDSSLLTKQADKKQKQLTKLMIYEQQLLKKNAQSLQASQMMKHKFVQVFVPPRQSQNSSRFLPDIRAKTNISKQSSNSSELVIL